MIEDEEQQQQSQPQTEQQQQQGENLPPEHPRWIGGSILIHEFGDHYDLDDLINQ